MPTQAAAGTTHRSFHRFQLDDALVFAFNNVSGLHVELPYIGGERRNDWFPIADDLDTYELAEIDEVSKAQTLRLFGFQRLFLCSLLFLPVGKDDALPTDQFMCLNSRLTPG